MKRGNAVKMVVLVSCGLFMFSFSACNVTSGGIHFGGGGRTVEKGGPPPHAPAHGYRAKHQYHYRYYPSRSVYYDTGRGLYFYIKGKNWEVGASLPSNLRVGLGDSVSIELDTDKPYLYHTEHVKKYPPGQMKKKKHKKKNKWG